MSQLMREDDGRSEVIVQITSSENRRFPKKVEFSGTALTARDLGVQASGDVWFALVQDADTVVLLVQRSGFNFAELRFNRSERGLVPVTQVPETTFVDWFMRVTRSW